MITAMTADLVETSAALIAEAAPRASTTCAPRRR
jgi:hypothetical protein